MYDMKNVMLILIYLKENKKLSKYLIKFYIKQKSFCLKIHCSMSLANFTFVVLHLKIHPAVNLNNLKPLASL